MKKTLITLISTLILTFSTPFSASAIPVMQTPLSEQGELSPLAEQTQWYFRINEDGVPQKRLWSITYGKWLTDWIDV